jgi:AbrB family looped-hinge helix DNA binding protein
MKITRKGQVTIPRELRARFGLPPQTEVEVAAGEGGVVIRPTHLRQIRFEEWRKCAKGLCHGEGLDRRRHGLTRGDV